MELLLRKNYKLSLENNRITWKKMREKIRKDCVEINNEKKVYYREAINKERLEKYYRFVKTLNHNLTRRAEEYYLSEIKKFERKFNVAINIIWAESLYSKKSEKLLKEVIEILRKWK